MLFNQSFLNYWVSFIVVSFHSLPLRIKIRKRVRKRSNFMNVMEATGDPWTHYRSFKMNIHSM